MKQKEQQRVLLEFREGFHNVLVCTSIGEEGLDIGQVDLIINFDCLSSPIRMVQRTGRTGRKRDGKVVCLVTKGEEEKKLNKSDSETKKIWRALKQSSHFSLVNNIPLTPFYPQMKMKAIEINSSYHLSQIGGYNRLRKRKKIKNNSQHDSLWQLSVTENDDCNKLFGCPTFSTFSVKKSITSWQNYLIKNRMYKAQRRGKSLGIGHSCLLLRRIEFLDCIENEDDFTTNKSFQHSTFSMKDRGANDARDETFSIVRDANDACSGSSSIVHDAIDACSESSSKYEYNDERVFEADFVESCTGSNEIKCRSDINCTVQDCAIERPLLPTSKFDLNRIFHHNNNCVFEQNESERKIQDIIFGNCEVLRPVTPPPEKNYHQQVIVSTQDETKSFKNEFEPQKENVQYEKLSHFDSVEDEKKRISMMDAKSHVVIFDEETDSRKKNNEGQDYIAPTHDDDELRCEFILPTQSDDSSSCEEERENKQIHKPTDDYGGESHSCKVSNRCDNEVQCEIVLPSQFDDSSTSSEEDRGNANLQGLEKSITSHNNSHCLEKKRGLDTSEEKITTMYDNPTLKVKLPNVPQLFCLNRKKTIIKLRKMAEEILLFLINIRITLLRVRKWD